MDLKGEILDIRKGHFFTHPHLWGMLKGVLQAKHKLFSLFNINITTLTSLFVEIFFYLGLTRKWMFLWVS